MQWTERREKSGETFEALRRQPAAGAWVLSGAQLSVREALCSNTQSALQLFSHV